VAGPLAGLAVALPAAWLGLAWSSVMPAVPHMAFGVVTAWAFEAARD